MARGSDASHATDGFGACIPLDPMPAKASCDRQLQESLDAPPTMRTGQRGYRARDRDSGWDSDWGSPP